MINYRALGLALALVLGPVVASAQTRSAGLGLNIVSTNVGSTISSGQNSPIFNVTTNAPTVANPAYPCVAANNNGVAQYLGCGSTTSTQIGNSGQPISLGGMGVLSSPSFRSVYLQNTYGSDMFLATTNIPDGAQGSFIVTTAGGGTSAQVGAQNNVGVAQTTIVGYPGASVVIGGSSTDNTLIAGPMLSGSTATFGDTTTRTLVGGAPGRSTTARTAAGFNRVDGAWFASAQAANNAFIKSRNATPGSHTIVNPGDAIGELDMFADDGANYLYTGGESWIVIGTPAQTAVQSQWVLQVAGLSGAFNGIVVNGITKLASFAGAVAPVGGIAAASTSTSSPRNFGTCAGAPNVAYTSQTPLATEFYVAEVFVPANVTVTGVAIYNSATISGNVKVGLANSSGANVATSASTPMAGTSADQLVPFTGTYAAVGPATYYVEVFYDNATVRPNAITAGACGVQKVAGQVFATGFTPFTPAGTFTSALGPVATLY